MGLNTENAGVSKGVQTLEEEPIMKPWLTEDETCLLPLAQEATDVDIEDHLRGLLTHCGLPVRSIESICCELKKLQAVCALYARLQSLHHKLGCLVCTARRRGKAAA